MIFLIFLSSCTCAARHAASFGERPSRDVSSRDASRSSRSDGVASARYAAKCSRLSTSSCVSSRAIAALRRGSTSNSADSPAHGQTPHAMR